MRDHESWSFRDRSFLWALLFSLLWHVFWFFSLTITVSAHKKVKLKTKLVSIGSVLDDSIFKTIVENRPQLSQAFYRPLSDLSPQLEPQPQPIERYSSGDVVSVPFSKKFSESMKDLLGGAKSAPDYELTPQLKSDRLEFFGKGNDPCKDKEGEDCPDRRRV